MGEMPGCRGTVTLAIDIATGAASDGSAAAAAGAAAGAAAAAAAPGSVVTVAKASFSLRPGVHQRIRIRIAHASKSYVKSLAQLPLALIVSVGGKHQIRYVAARTKLRT